MTKGALAKAEIGDDCSRKASAALDGRGEASLGLGMLTTLIALAVSAMAFMPADSDKSRVELIASRDALVAGESMVLALRFEIEPRWHIYWKDPGDSGMSPSVKWTLPPGVTVGELEYPKPKVYETSSGVNYVHEGPAVLIVRLDAAGLAGASTDGEVKIGAALKWLVCDEDLCLPDEQKMEITLPVRNQSTAVRMTDFEAWTRAVDSARDHDPRPTTRPAR
jgi:DsbC/DsbD-like thiol-disulfide interchange protein